MDIATVAENFVRAMSHCDNLITVHKNHGGTGAGRRREETSLNRAVIVIAVASWQSFVQDAATSLAWLGQPPAGSGNTNFYLLVKGRVNKEIDSLNTPNANNSRRLLRGAGYDPFPSWTWQVATRGRGSRTTTSHENSDKLDQWLKIRHAIAHGDRLLPPCLVLESVRQGKHQSPAGAALHRADAEDCVEHIRLLVESSGAGMAAHLGLTNASTWR
jgi:hypothetical protein